MKYSKLFASGLVLISQQPQTTVAEDVQSIVRGSSPSKHERTRTLSATHVNVTVPTRGSVRLPFRSQGPVPSYLRPTKMPRFRSKDKSSPSKSKSPEKKSDQPSSSESTFLSLDISSDEKSSTTVLDSPTLGESEEESLSAISVSLPGYGRRPSSVYVPTRRERTNTHRRSSFIPSLPTNPWGLTPEDTEWQLVHSPTKSDEELEDWWQFHQDFLSENSK